jgi:hypothetical protein
MPPSAPSIAANAVLVFPREDVFRRFLRWAEHNQVEVRLEVEPDASQPDQPDQLDRLGVDGHIKRVLRANQIFTPEQLAGLTEDQVRALDGIGWGRYFELVYALRGLKPKLRFRGAPKFRDMIEFLDIDWDLYLSLRCGDELPARKRPYWSYNFRTITAICQLDFIELVQAFGYGGADQIRQALRKKDRQLAPMKRDRLLVELLTDPSNPDGSVDELPKRLTSYGVDTLRRIDTFTAEYFLSLVAYVPVDDLLELASRITDYCGIKFRQNLTEQIRDHAAQIRQASTAR